MLDLEKHGAGQGEVGAERRGSHTDRGDEGGLPEQVTCEFFLSRSSPSGGAREFGQMEKLLI